MGAYNSISKEYIWYLIVMIFFLQNVPIVLDQFHKKYMYCLNNQKSVICLKS